MFVKCLKDCEEFTAGDGSILRELLHPEKADLQIHYSLAYATVAAGRVKQPAIRNRPRLYCQLPDDFSAQYDSWAKR